MLVYSVLECFVGINFKCSDLATINVIHLECNCFERLLCRWFYRYFFAPCNVRLNDFTFICLLRLYGSGWVIKISKFQNIINLPKKKNNRILFTVDKSTDFLLQFFISSSPLFVYVTFFVHFYPKHWAFVLKEFSTIIVKFIQIVNLNFLSYKKRKKNNMKKKPWGEQT